MKNTKNILQFIGKNFATGFIIVLGGATAFLGVYAFQTLTTTPGDFGNQSLSAPMLSMINGTFNRQNHSLEAIYENIKWYNDSGLKRMFLTSLTYNGNLGGISGADAKCQAEADANNLGGNWIAIIGDSTQSFRERYNTLVKEQNYKLKGFLTLQGGEGPASWYPYGPLPSVNTDYYNFFNNTFPVSAMFSFYSASSFPRPTLANGSLYTSAGVYYFWSGINSQGLTQVNNHCENWTSTAVFGSAGYHRRATTPYIDFKILSSTNIACSNLYHLACLEI